MSPAEFFSNENVERSHATAERRAGGDQPEGCEEVRLAAAEVIGVGPESPAHR